jgi:cation diffusion facilitator family transporter
MSPARRTALFSLGAAVGLVAAKLVVGLASGSLGILAEAAHSGVDAVGALIAFYSITVAERPADPEHQYGHGKAQHLSGLAESMILAGVSVWIAIEGVSQLVSGSSQVRATWYAFALMGGVLVVDATRSVLSRRSGRRERSAALLASAGHFAADFMGTLAVFVGLLLVSAGYTGADAVAAIFVAVLVFLGALRLAAPNVDALMDRAPSGVAGSIAEVVGGVSGVSEVRSVRVREAGGQYFADVVIGVPRREGLERTHATMDRVEDVVERSLGHTQVTVHVEPSRGFERANERVAAAALRVPGVEEVHNITVLEDGGGRAITLHARVDENLSLPAAGEILDRLRAEIRREVDASNVYVHAEPFAPDAQPARDVTDEDGDAHRKALTAVRRVAGGDARVVVYRQGPRLLVVTALRAGDGLTVRDGHALASEVEDAVRDALPDVDEVIVEVSPAGG